MELRHLRYFAEVAETRHFGRAADRLHMAQPALSQSIRQLEAELGTPLFVRTTRQVRLTPAGEFFQLEVARILESVEAGVRGVRRIAAGRQGLVRIAFTGSAAHTELPRMARIVKRELPGMALEIHADLLTPAQVDGLHDGTLDLGVLRPPMPGDGLASRTLSTEPLVLAVAEDHPLAHQPSISMSDLRTERFVLFSGPDSAVNDAVLRSAREVGLRADPRARGGRHLGPAAARRRRPRRRAGPRVRPGGPARGRGLPRRHRRRDRRSGPRCGAPTRPTPRCSPSSTCCPPTPPSPLPDSDEVVR